jgi:hypothetical protein
MTMCYQLAAFCSGGTPAQQINHVVEAAFTNAQELFARDPAFAFRHKKIFVELAFAQAIVTARKLFGTQLLAVFRRFSASACLPMLSGRVGAAFKRTFACVATVAFEKQFLSFTAAKLADGFGIS